MNEFIKILAIAIIGVILALTVKRTNAELALVISVTTGLVIIFNILSIIDGVQSKFSMYASAYSLPRAIYEPLVKCMLICVTAKICGEICRQSGESALALKVDLAGSLAGILAAFPLLEYVLTLISSMPAVN